MSLRKPTREVEYSSNGTDWTSLKDDVRSFDLELCDLVEGIWNFKLHLNNKNGKYNSVFPTIPTEAGLHHFFRFSINGILLAIGRAMEISSGLGSEDTMEINGQGLSRETLGLKCTVDDYRGYKGDQIIYDQMSQAGPWYDLNYPSSPYTAPVYTKVIGENEKTPIRDLMAEIAEAIDYVVYFKEDEKPAPFRFFPKNDSTRRLNVVLRNILFSQENRIVSGKESRSIDRIKNYLTLQGGKYFREDIPNGRDELTEDISGPTGTYWIAIIGTVSKDTGDKVVGEASIKCETASGLGPRMRLGLVNSGWGVNPLNPDSEGVDRLTWLWKDSGNVTSPQVSLVDDQAKEIWYTFSASAAWGERQVGVGAANIGMWSGDTEEFNWNITEIRFHNIQAHGDDPATIRVDNLYFFKSGGYDQLYLKDQASIDKYGRRDEELAVPSAFPFINMKAWGDKMLQKYAKPLRTLELSCLIDPATVKLVDGVTPSKLYPGYQVQLQIPRWNIKLVADGGVWWRILKPTYHWGGSGFNVELSLVPTGAESPEDYSHVSGSRILHHENPLAAFINMLTKRGYG